MHNVMHILTDSNIGGAGIWLIRVLEAMPKGFKMTVVLPKDSMVKSYIDHLKNVDVIELESITDCSISIKSTYDLYKVIRFVKPDVVHTHASLSGRIAAKICRVYTLNSRHCIEPVGSGIVFRLKNWINRLLSNRIIAVSDGVYENLIESHIPKKQIIKLTNGISIEDFKSVLDKEHAKDIYGMGDRVVIGFVGRLAEVKGPMRLPVIMKRLLEITDIPVGMLIAGTGPLAKELAASIESNHLKEQVKLVGFVKKLPPLYQAMDICINTSDSEALSLSLLEAMAASLPVVSYNLNGVNEVVRDGVNGYCVKPYELEAYADVLKRLVEDQTLRSVFGEQGHNIVQEEYSLDHMVTKLARIYKEKEKYEAH